MAVPAHEAMMAVHQGRAANDHQGETDGPTKNWDKKEQEQNADAADEHHRHHGEHADRRGFLYFRCWPVVLVH